MPRRQVGEVVRIGDVARCGGENEIRVAGEFRGPVRQPLDLDDAGEHVEHPRQNVHRPGRVLADHVEHGVAQAVVVGDGYDEHDLTVSHDRPGRQVTRRHAAQGVAEVIDDAAGGERVVDAGRERPHRDLDELANRVFQVLQGGRSTPEGQRAANGILGALDAGGEERDGKPSRHVVARPCSQRDDDAMLVGPIGQLVLSSA